MIVSYAASAESDWISSKSANAKPGAIEQSTSTVSESGTP